MTDQKHSSETTDPTLEKEIAEALGDFSVMDMVDEVEPGSAGAGVGAGEGSASQGSAASGGGSGPASIAAGAEDPKTARGQIVAIHDDDVFVDLGGKSQGIVSLTQFKEPPELGTEMEFVVEGVLGDEGLVKLSRQGAVEKATWQSLERGMVVEAVVTGSNTGGLELKLAGQRAFMPASQIDLARVEKFNDWLGQKLRCQVIELNRRQKKIVLSRRAVLEAEAKAARDEVLSRLEVGAEMEGTVRNIRDFGAFVDIGGVDGLVHVSDMSYERNQKAADLVEVGQKVRVKVLKIEEEGNRISLGMKQVGPNPWDMAASKYQPGAAVTGTVSKLTNFGVFVTLEPGIEGLIPMGELSWDRVGRPSQVVQSGQAVTVKILDVDAERQRVSLSLKQMGEDPWMAAEAEYAPDAVVEGKVTRTAEFGAFVELKPGVEGMIHISELSDKHVASVEQAVQVGQQVQVKVLSVDLEKRRIGLSIRALIAKPEQQADAGDRGRSAKPSKSDMKKYVVEDTGRSKAQGGDSLASLLEKFGDDHGKGLKGGLG